MSRITIVDYGLGNLLSVERAVRRSGADVRLASSGREVEAAEALVLPGVGAFADGMAGLRERGLVGPLRAGAAAGKPILAICLGMHLLFERGTEFGVHEGLAILPGEVRALPRTDAQGRRSKTPHIGWSPVRSSGTGCAAPELSEALDDRWFYFVHSFAGFPSSADHCVATARYGGNEFPAAVALGRVLGVQFHPEKSGNAGLRLIETFVRSSVPSFTSGRPEASPREARAD